MNRARRSLPLVAVVIALLAIVATGMRAHAQIDPLRTSVGIYQSRAGAPPQLVGEIYREGTDPTTYVEHWVLYPGYVYPSGTNLVITGLRPALRGYSNLTDFFARVPFAPGSRYVRVDCTDTDQRPIAR